MMFNQQEILLSQEHYLDLRREAEQQRFIQAAGLGQPVRHIQIEHILAALRRKFSLFQSFPEALFLAKHVG